MRRAKKFDSKPAPDGVGFFVRKASAFNVD
uniref:Uncharacterized protein n=1 Tax=Providencia stuartii TaxID=588 RepID=A0A899NFY1_PROST|nr:hypothetical protein EKPLLCFL_00091 [Providencia stuartii]UII02344.1 hypothetical protein [Providencia rettgeri]